MLNDSLKQKNGGLLFFFFFSSRRRHTRLQGDWSSDVCSSDLWLQDLRRSAANKGPASAIVRNVQTPGRRLQPSQRRPYSGSSFFPGSGNQKEARSEERRVGKECRSRWSPYH